MDKQLVQTDRSSCGATACLSLYHMAHGTVKTMGNICDISRSEVINHYKTLLQDYADILFDYNDHKRVVDSSISGLYNGFIQNN